MSEEKSHKIRYIIFIATVIITIIANELIVQYNINLQLTDAKIINMAGKQRMLSQRITKEVLFLEDTLIKTNQANLRNLAAEWSKAHSLLSQGKAGIKNTAKIDSLFERIEPHYLKILNGTEQIIDSNTKSTISKAVKVVLSSESQFLKLMDDIVLLYQKNAEDKLKRTKKIVLLLSCLSVLVLLGEFVFIIIPFFTKLNAQNKQLNQTNRRLSDFAHITSHNLRAPVSNLNSLLHIYDVSEDQEEKEEVMNKFKTVVKHLNTTMETLVGALQTQHSSSKEIEPVSLNEVLAKTKEILENKIEESKIEIKSDFAVVSTMDYSKVYMESIFLNLISNAIKYRSPDRSPEILIVSKLEKGKTVLTFSDNGLGIDLKKHGDKLFGLSKTFHRHPDARGVGLFMTRAQIESLGGTITAKSKLNEGTEFKIVF
jgi:signal transduction histidine kinase